MKNNFGLQHYNRPTPRFWRKLGDALLASSTLVTGHAIITDHPNLALLALIVGAVGKFLTNFFSK